MRKSKDLSKNILFSCLLLFSFIPCNANKESSTNWININYVKCLENKLPCECEKEVGSYFVIKLDTVLSTILLLKHDDVEVQQYGIERESRNSYKVITLNDKINFNIVKVIIKENELFLYDNKNRISKFIYYVNSKFNNDIKYFKQNVSLLNKAFIKRGYDSLEKILMKRLLNCQCCSNENNTKDKVNLIYTDDISRSWVLKIKNDRLYLDDQTTRKVLSYKWEKLQH